MVFGITGGLTFAYLPFIKITNMPVVASHVPRATKGAAKNPASGSRRGGIDRAPSPS
jgi:hypothetical protein